MTFGQVRNGCARRGILIVPCMVGAALLFGCGDATGPRNDEPLCLSTVSPIAAYPFDGNALDVSGNGNHGTVAGATLTSDRFGGSDRAYSFDGIDDAITIGNGVQPPFPLTVSLWFKTGDMRFAHIFANDDANDSANRWGVGILLGQNGVIGSNTYEGFSAAWNRLSYDSQAENLFTPGAWHHIAVVFKANSDRAIYFDGVEQSGVYSGTGSSMQYGGGSGMIGRIHGNSAPKFQFLGSLDDIQVFDLALSQQQILDIFTQPAGCV